MLIIDVNTSFGRMPGGGRAQPLEVLLQETARYGIALAATSSLKAVYYHHTEGNDDSLAAAHTHPNLLPVAVLNPKQIVGHEEEIDRRLREGFRLFRFYPEEQGWDISCLPFRRILGRLAGTGAVIAMPAGNWGTISRLASETAAPSTGSGQAPGLPLIALGVHYTQVGECIEVMERYPHVYAEVHRLGTYRALEMLVQRVGSERVLFGSGAPQKPLASALNVVWFADLSDMDRQAIFGGNAVRLLGLSKTIGSSAVAPTPPTLPERIFDVHVHLGRWSLPTPVVSAAETVTALRKYHVETCVLSPSLLVYDYAEGNRQVEAAIADHPSLLAYVAVDPNDLAGSCAEMDRCFHLDNFVGVGELHCSYSRQPTASAAVRALVAEVARRGRPLLIHNDGSGYATALLELARTHPHLKIIIAHAGPGWPDPAAFAAAAQADNLYLEFCTTYPWRGAVRAAIDSVGPERVLFGSDFPLIDPGYVLGHYGDAELSTVEEEKIMYTNARDLFGR